MPLQLEESAAAFFVGWKRHEAAFGFAREALQPAPPPGSWFRGRPWRADFPALLAPRGWRITHFAPCVRFVQTEAPSQNLKRTSTCAPRGAALLGPAQFARQRHGLQGACIAVDVPRQPWSTPPPEVARPADGRFVRGRGRSGAAQARAEVCFKRASSSDSAPLFDHSERSERREFGAAEPRSEQRGESARPSRPANHEPGGGTRHRSEKDRYSGSPQCAERRLSCRRWRPS